MFFNIFNLLIFIFKLLFKFMFIFKYLTPFFYNLINNLLNKKDSPILVNKLLNRNLNNKGKAFNVLYCNLSSNLSHNLTYYFLLKKIILHNNSKKFPSVEIFYFILSYVLVYASRFENVKLVCHNNFFSFQQINKAINMNSIVDRNQSMRSKLQGHIISKLSFNFNKFKDSYKKIISLPKVKLTNLYKNIIIKFNSTSIDRLLNTSQFYNILFIRNFKAFNKGRYSRNRQYYRTGVY